MLWHRKTLTFLLYIEEALHRPLSRSFKVLLCWSYPSHQILHFLSCALEVISRLQKEHQNNILMVQQTFASSTCNNKHFQQIPHDWFPLSSTVLHVYSTVQNRRIQTRLIVIQTHVIWRLLHSGDWTGAVACMAQIRGPARNPHGRKWTVPGGRPAAERNIQGDWRFIENRAVLDQIDH